MHESARFKSVFVNALESFKAISGARAQKKAAYRSGRGGGCWMNWWGVRRVVSLAIHEVVADPVRLAEILIATIVGGGDDVEIAVFIEVTVAEQADLAAVG